MEARHGETKRTRETPLEEEVIALGIRISHNRRPIKQQETITTHDRCGGKAF
jgi:hypothetical protein